MTFDYNYWPDLSWRTELPENMGVDSEILHDADRFIEMHAKRINSLLIVKNGYLITEKYYNGYLKDKYLHICSVTKSILSSLIGIAIDRGHIDSLDQPILDIFNDTDPRQTHYLMQAVTVKHLLLMSSGIVSRYNRNGNEPLWGRMESSQNWVEFILKLPIVEERMNKFNYTSMNSHLLSAIISRTTGMSAAEYANKHLFNAIGLAPAYSSISFGDASMNEEASRWLADPQGINNGGFGLYLRPVDLARYGYLYLRQGNWGENQVISSNWILQSVDARAHHANYGLHWWLERDYQGYSAQGYGGQALYVIPEKDSVIVITSRSDSRATSGRAPADILRKYILPALT